MTVDGLVTWEELQEVLPSAIAAGISHIVTTPAPGLSLSTATVESVGNGTVEVQFDDDEPGITAIVQGSALVGQRVPIVHGPGGQAFVFAGSPTTASPGGSSSSGSGPFAEWTAPGLVIPVPASSIVEVDGPGTIAKVVLTMRTAPLAGRSCVVDVFLNGVSLWANPSDRPTFTSLSTNPLTTACAATVAADDLLSAEIVDGGSGRDLTIRVLP